MRPRAALDTNLYISYLIRDKSVPGQAVVKAWDECTLLISEETFEELRTVVARPKFSRYIRSEIETPFLDQVWAISELVAIPSPIRACRDPRDDKFLELAVHGRADLLLTGDADLLALHPFHGVTILTPAAFLSR
ncbi:MAG: putative toxin-antitoxin system toxin component, PIN family [Terracidiphilus sp.]